MSILSTNNINNSIRTAEVYTDVVKESKALQNVDVKDSEVAKIDGFDGVLSSSARALNGIVLSRVKSVNSSSDNPLLKMFKDVVTTVARYAQVAGFADYAGAYEAGEAIISRNPNFEKDFQNAITHMLATGAALYNSEPRHKAFYEAINDKDVKANLNTCLETAIKVIPEDEDRYLIMQEGVLVKTDIIKEKALGFLSEDKNIPQDIYFLNNRVNVSNIVDFMYPEALKKDYKNSLIRLTTIIDTNLTNKDGYADINLDTDGSLMIEVNEYLVDLMNLSAKVLNTSADLPSSNTINELVSTLTKQIQELTGLDFNNWDNGSNANVSNHPLFQYILDIKALDRQASDLTQAQKASLYSTFKAVFLK